MGIVARVTQRNRGFARVGPDADQLSQGIAAAMGECGYEREAAGGDIWIRYEGRRTGFPRPYARILTVCRRPTDGTWDSTWVQNADPYYDRFGQEADLIACTRLVSEAANKSHHAFLYSLDTAFMLCRRADRAAFLEQAFLPAYFQRFPNGRIIVIGTNSEFERRLSPLRIGNFLQVNGIQALRDLNNHGIRSPQTAAGIHNSEAVALDTALSALLGNLMPLRTHIVGGRLGLRLIYLFGNSDPPAIDRGPFPRDEVELYGSHVFYRGDDFTGMDSPSTGWIGRFRNTQYPGDDSMEELVAVLIERFNLHIENRLEVCNYVDGETVDFIECFEKYLSIDRILHECLMIATATNPATARLMTVAVLDKFQELCRFPGVARERQFHYMCTRPFLQDVLLPAFSTMPATWRDHFRAQAEALYDDLYRCIRSDRCVWPHYLVQSSGVRVYREWDGHQFVDRPTPMSDDDFVGEYVRAVRNTHHGYVSDGDRRRRFACFGSLTTASLPDSFTQLPLLILLAEIVAPERLSGWHWLDQGGLNLTV